MEQTMRRQEQLPGAFSGATTNSQHGRVRWYLVHTPHGKERETCEKVRRIIPHELMQDAFVMQKEFWFKRDGAWWTWAKATPHLGSCFRWTCPVRRKGDVAPAIRSHFEFIDWGIPGGQGRKFDCGC